jgi:hypothetical protein
VALSREHLRREVVRGAAQSVGPPAAVQLLGEPEVGDLDVAPETKCMLIEERKEEGAVPKTYLLSSSMFSGFKSR